MFLAAGLAPTAAAAEVRLRLTTSFLKSSTPSHFVLKKNLPPVIEKELNLTAFALDRFQERADRGGVSPVILSTHTMGTRGSPLFERMKAMAEARGIPVIDQHDYILCQGGRIEDAHWAYGTPLRRSRLVLAAHRRLTSALWSSKRERKGNRAVLWNMNPNTKLRQSSPPVKAHAAPCNPPIG